MANDTPHAGVPEHVSGDGGLLAPDEPAPFDIFNVHGSASVFFLCDHASRFVPRGLKSLGVSEADLERHIAWDIGIAEVTRNLAARFDAPALLSHFSRLVIDPNRSLDDPTLIPQLSDGVIVPGNRNLSVAERRARIETFHVPYHNAIAGILDRAVQSGREPALISMHSFTPTIKGVERPWQIGVLWNHDDRIAVPLIATLRAQGLSVGDNEPYSGRDGHGYTLHTHAEPRGLPHVLIEVRQDLIDTHHGASAWAERLSAVMSVVLGVRAMPRARVG